MHRRRASGPAAVGAAAISLIDAGGNNTAASIDITCQAGDYIVLCDGRTGTTAALGSVSGFAQLGEDGTSGGTNCAFRLFGRVATGTDETIPANDGTIHSRTYAVYRGVDGSTPVRDSTVNTGSHEASGVAIAIPAVASSTPDGRAVGGFVCRGTSNSALTVSSPLTERAAQWNGTSGNRNVLGDTGDTLVASFAGESVSLAANATWTTWSLMLNPA